MPSGVLVIDKPSGMTSHDVVNVVRRLADTRRVGHAGTLDPIATGLLVVLVGPTTRLSQYVMHGDKRYSCVARLGETTSTYDAEGDVLDRSPVDLRLNEIESAMRPLTGAIEQVPPMYSAIKVDGRKLYELAREGKEIQRKPRFVTIRSLSIVDWQPPDLTLDIVCTPGTYIRSLVHDLGKFLGCGGHVRALRRVASAPFTEAQAHTLDELRELCEGDSIASALLPPAAALGEMPMVRLTPEQERAVRYGQAIDLATETDPLQARDACGHLIGILSPISATQCRPTLVLPPLEDPLR